MNKALFLFLILLLGMVLCYILGGDSCKEGLTSNEIGVSGAGTGLYPSTMTNTGDDDDDDKELKGNNNYDYYNHYNGTSSQLVNNMNFYGPKGEIATVNTNSDGTQTITVKLKDGMKPLLFTVNKPSIDDNTNNNTINNNIYYGPDGSIAKIVNTSSGQQAIKIKTKNGIMMFFLVGPVVDDNMGISSTQYYGSTGTPIDPRNYSLAYTDTDINTNTVNSESYQTQTPYKSVVESVTGSNSTSSFYAKGPYDNASIGLNYNQYSNSLPQGIPKNQIPPGDEDLYILKSQVVPPVCPVCPTSPCEKEKECPACPPCGRCPEPAFECKKVPNYNSINNTYLPVPVVNDFSTFGM